MRAVAQRVSQARVTVAGEEVGAIGTGLLVLVGMSEGDGERDLEWMARKIVGLRVFPDEDGRMNRSVADIGGAVLLVSQFTLCAEVEKGSRPSFVRAMEPERAQAMFEQLVQRVGAKVPVATGRFRAHMAVELVNDGPVTLWLSSERGAGERRS